MTRLLILCVSTFLCFSTSAQDFRKASWGNSKQEVKLQETGVEFYEQESGIFEFMMFKSKIANLDVFVAFIFVEDKLVRTKYSFIEEHTNKNDYITDFDTVGKILSSKYGETDRKEIWKDDLYKDDASDYGMAIAVGDYLIARQWEIKDATSITQLLSGDNYDITHVIEYNSVLLKNFVEEKKKEAEGELF